MADWTDVLLNIGGWVVAGIVTLAGVLVAYRLERRARWRDEDRRDIHEPLHKDLKTLVERIPYARQRGDLPYYRLDSLGGIVERGLLLPRRQRKLKDLIERLEGAGAKLNTEQRKASDLGTNLVNEAFRAAEFRGADGKTVMTLAALMERHQNGIPYNEEMLKALVLSDKDRWNKGFENAAKIYTTRSDVGGQKFAGPSQERILELYSQALARYNEGRPAYDMAEKELSKVAGEALAWVQRRLERAS